MRILGSLQFEKVFRSFLIGSLLLPLVGIIVYSCSSESQAEVPELTEQVPAIIDFNFHVKPILSDRCFKCHGPDPNTREGELGLHSPDFAFLPLGKDKDRYAIRPGNKDSSTLIHRILTDNPDDIMPPPESNLMLTEGEKEILTRWVEQGAKWKPHWAFISPTKTEVPNQPINDWIRNEIDYFVFRKLEEKQFQPSPPSEKEKLLRRVTFDLTGLPPTPAELLAFVEDPSPDAFEKQVDRILVSEAFGERMAIDWMEIARYADTHGYQDDFERVMWPWRDWVIHAFNENMPYDQFIKWQLAGDLMPDATLEMIVATAFNRNHKITAEGGVIPEEYRTEYVADRSQTISTAFLGLTMECARCHDHKYDPISQKDYFSMFAFFNNIPEVGLIGMNDRTAEPRIKISKDEIANILDFINNRNQEEEIPLMIMKEMDKPRETFVLNRGLYDQPTEKVTPSAPSFISAFDSYRPDRLGLVNWLFDDENPLTARVAVNRLWQQLFGVGIVSTSYDFGNQGALPTHPELLDFLAIKYKKEGWDTKAMLKYIVMSATYQQTSKSSEELQKRDPDNQYLARAPRLRLTAEMIRDQALSVSGLLNDEVGGPSVKPYQPEGLWKETTGGGGGSTARYEMDSGSLVYRRSLYTFWKRTVPPPGMMTFDTSTRDLCTVKRQQTSTPLQALVLLNDPQLVEASRALADYAVLQKTVAAERISLMFERVTSRRPNENELKTLLSYFESQMENFEVAPERADSYLRIGQYEAETVLDTPVFAAYALVANAILNLDESITRG